MLQIYPRICIRGRTLFISPWCLAGCTSMKNKSHKIKNKVPLLLQILGYIPCVINSLFLIFPLLTHRALIIEDELIRWGWRNLISLALLGHGYFLKRLVTFIKIWIENEIKAKDENDKIIKSTIVLSFLCFSPNFIINR